MKIGEIVLAWAFSVIVGSLICGLFTSEILVSIIFAIISGLLSIPYLILMILLSRKRFSFIIHQLIHFLLAFSTGLVIVLFENGAFQGWYVLVLYFVLGVGAQAYFYFRRPLDSKVLNDDLLDG